MKLFVLPLSQNLVEESAYLGEKQFDVLLLLFESIQDVQSGHANHW